MEDFRGAQERGRSVHMCKRALTAVEWDAGGGSAQERGQSFNIDIITGDTEEAGMPRLARREFEGAMDHVMARRDRREANVRDGGDPENLCADLGVSERARWVPGSWVCADEQPLPFAAGDSEGELIARNGLDAERVHAPGQHASPAFGGMSLADATNLSWWSRATAFGHCSTIFISTRSGRG